MQKLHALDLVNPEEVTCPVHIFRDFLGSLQTVFCFIYFSVLLSSLRISIREIQIVVVLC